jgi:hypothetical protein
VMMSILDHEWATRRSRADDLTAFDAVANST